MDELINSERCDWQSPRIGGLMLVTVVLMSVGLVMVTSATLPLDRSVEDVEIWRSVFGRQAIFTGVGLLMLPVSMRVSGAVLSSVRWRRALPKWLFGLVVLGLMIALVPALVDPQHGARRWLRFGSLGLGVQPSELAKPALVGLLAYMLTERGSNLADWRRGFLPLAFVVGLTVLLVGKEDFGTAALIGAVGMFMMLVGGAAIAHLSALALVGAVVFVGLLYAAPYRMARLVAFQDIWSRAQDEGYQPVQSLTAIGAGGWFGTGLGAGIQKYGYLPEAHSDFVFSIICEETGFMGGAVVIALLCAFVWLGLRTMWSARTAFERMLAFGLTAVVGLQAAMNIAVVTVMAPTTGISLPFISAGGSGLLILCLSVGVLAAIAARGHTESAAAQERDAEQAIRFGATGLGSGAAC